MVSYPCFLRDDSDLPGETPIYKYFSVENFLSLLAFKKLFFSKITKWPDGYEGCRYNHLKKIKKESFFPNKKLDDFFASCWSLQTEDSCFYKNEKGRKEAIDELRGKGSASMWENYCRKGGVRVKTTLCKMKNLLETNTTDTDILYGKVYYEPASIWEETIKCLNLETTLFMKRVPFRHESEYRYILVPKNTTAQFLPVEIDNWFDFFDEILISPASTPYEWVSQSLLKIADRFFIDQNSIAPRYICKISELYEPLSSER